MKDAILTAALAMIATGGDRGFSKPPRPTEGDGFAVACRLFAADGTRLWVSTNDRDCGISIYFACDELTPGADTPEFLTGEFCLAAVHPRFPEIVAAMLRRELEGITENRRSEATP